jgi:adenylosuccinate lyase
MIERYRLETMHKLFQDESKFNAFLAVEIAALKAFSKLGKIPKEDVEKIEMSAQVDVQRIKAIEQETKHDVIAFTRAVSETLGEEKKWVHYGLTSTDVVDTAMSVLYQQANQIIDTKLNIFMEVLKEKAYAYKDTPCIGRTHGIHADITAFGLKFALYYDEFTRHKKRFKAARETIEVGQISGAVGNFANTPPQIQDDVCKTLHLASANISTQTLQRDRHVEYMNSLVMMATSIEKIAVEIRHLQRTEVGEVREAFSKNQKGSSAMPHKKNPIASENMTGCARIMRGYLSSVYENVSLWHERDISHSSVERVVFPDALMLLDYMFTRYTKVIKTLEVNTTRMKTNIDLTYGVIFSQRVMHALIDQGLSREEAYDIIQPLTNQAYTEGVQFIDILKTSTTITKYLSHAIIESCFTLDHYLKEVDTILTRVFKEN